MKKKIEQKEKEIVNVNVLASLVDFVKIIILQIKLRFMFRLFILIRGSLVSSRPRFADYLAEPCRGNAARICDLWSTEYGK